MEDKNKEKEIRLCMNSEQHQVEFCLQLILLQEVLTFNKYNLLSTTIFQEKCKLIFIELVVLVDLVEKELPSILLLTLMPSFCLILKNIFKHKLKNYQMM